MNKQILAYLIVFLTLTSCDDKPVEKVVLPTNLQTVIIQSASEEGLVNVTATAYDENYFTIYFEDGEETENPIQQIKALGVAGAISYALWEGAFWTVGGAGAVVAYFFATGHWPDLSDNDDKAKLGAEAFAFINIARFIVPLRIGLAVGTAPWVDENIVKRFNLSNDDE